MMDTETPAAHVQFNTTSPMEVASGGNWAAFYFLAAYGGLAYFITFASFPLLYFYVKKGNLWNPLKVKQVGLTQLAVVGGFSWYLYNLILEVLPDEAQQKLLPANTATCWFRHFWIITCVCLFSNSILLKQYRSYIRYVARESLAPPYSHFTIASVPYFILALLPFWNGYDSTTDTCERDSIASLLLYVWMCIVFIACMCLLNTLRDTCTYYPNLQASFAEVIGFLVLTLVRAYEIWFTCSDCLSAFTRSYISAFLLVTIPNAVFWIVLGRSLWKVHTGDLEYCRELERLCSPTSHLISHTQDEEEQQINDPHTEGSLPPTDSPGQQAPRMRPNYSKGNRGEFFETDRLTALISSGDNSEVKSFILETNLNLIHILDREGFAPLHRAVLAGSEDLVNFLLEMNCDPNFPSREGDRAIHFAARQGEMGIVSLLHGANADINAVSHRGITPLHYAVLSSSSEAVRTFLDRGAMPTIPHQEASSESWEKVHILDAGRMKNYWKRPLTLAVELGLSSAVSLMVHAQPASLDYSCAHSLTYLMMSIALGHKSVAEALLNVCYLCFVHFTFYTHTPQAGADVWKICNRRKRNVLHYNAMQGSRTIFQLLKYGLVRFWVYLLLCRRDGRNITHPPPPQRLVPHDGSS